MKIRLENFGQHRALALETQAKGTVLFVVGKNRVGKSTVRDAIEFALLGSCKIRGFGLKKDVATHMITEGQSVATVTLNAGSWTVSRSITRGGSSNIQLDRTNSGEFVEVNATQWNDFFPDRHADADAIRVALDFNQFFMMDANARRKLLISVKDSEGIDEKTAWDALGTALTSFAKEKPEREGQLRAVCSMAAMLGFKHANKEAVEHRKAEKRAYAKIEQDIASMPDTITEVDGIDVTKATLEQHQEKVNDLEEMVAEMLNQRALASGRDTGRLTEAIEHLDRAQARCDAAARKLVRVEFEGETRDFAASEIAPMVEEVEIAVAKLKVTLAECRQAEGDQRSLFDSAKKMVDTMAALSKSPPQCPAVGFTMKCPVRPTTFATAYEKSGGEADAMKSAQGQVSLHEGNHRDAAVNLEDATLAVQDAESHAELWRMALTEATLQESERASADSALADVQERIAELKTENQDTGIEVATDDELEAAEKRLALGHKVVNLRALLEERKDKEIALRADSAKLNLEILWWDEIEKLLRPDGIEATLAGMATSHFAEILKTCDPLAEVRIDDNMELTINGHDLTTRSKSEQLCGGIALQSAMCFQVGLPFLVVDELDKLDAYWKRAFQAWAAKARETFSGGIIALATSDADPPGVPPDGFVTAWLREGEGCLHLGGEFE